MALRYYANAPATALTNSCTALATSLEVDSVTGLPISYPYTLIVDRGLASEEAVSVTAAAGTTLTVTRGIDSTTAFAHAIGATVVHGITAQDIREPNAHINASDGVHGVTGDLVGTTDTQTLTNKTVDLTSNTVTGTKAEFESAVSDGDPVWADEIGLWQAYAPTWSGTGSNPALGNGTITGRYAQVGKIVHFRIEVVMGSTTTYGSGRWDLTLPVAQHAGLAVVRPLGIAVAYDLSGGRYYAHMALSTGTGGVYCWRDIGVEATVTPTTPITWATGDILMISGTYEAA